MPRSDRPDAELTIVVKIIVSGSETSFVHGEDQVALPLYPTVDLDASTGEPVQIAQARRWRPRGVVLGVGAAAIAVALTVGLLTAPSRPDPMAAESPVGATDVSAATREAVLASPDSSTHRDEELTPSLAPTVPPAETVSSSDAILAGLDPDERRYVAGVMALTREQLSAGSGNAPTDFGGAVPWDGVTGCSWTSSSSWTSSPSRGDYALQP
jgi:hypothetical protein